MDFRSYVALEVALTRRLVKDWKKVSVPLYKRIAQAVQDENWHLATQLAYDLDLTEVGEKNKEYIKYMMLSCAVFGSKMANKHGPQFLPVGTYDSIMTQVTSNFLQYLEHKATNLVQGRALQLIADAERKAKSQLLSSTMKMEPSSLYVYRKVLNHQAISDWATAHGFKTTLGSDMHVTIVYSKQPVDWTSSYPKVKTLSEMGGSRTVEPLGDEGAVVLKFQSSALGARWGEWRDLGASWDYEGYTPHITLSYELPSVPLEMVPAYEGPLELGPEIYEPLDENWEDGLVEKSDLALADLSTGGLTNPQLGYKKKKKVVKADSSGRYVTDFVTFADDGEQALQLASSLNSSRLSTWGFGAESKALGRTQYQLTAVLDGRTSAFCQLIDGRVFDVDAADAHVSEALSAQNPEDLVQIQPWPDQSQAAIAEYASMSDQELQDAGFSIPPFHPNCRTMLTELQGDSNGVGEAPPSLGDAGGEYTPDDFQDLGSAPNPDQLSYWNDYVAADPKETLGDLFGLTPKDVNSDETTNSIGISKSGMISFATDALTAGFSATQILDPLTNKLYLSDAEFLAGDSGAATKTLGDILGGMISTAPSLGVDTLVVSTGVDAFAYAKMGFVPGVEDWQHVRLQAMDDLHTGGVLAPVFKQLNDDQQTFVLNLLSNVDEGSLTVLTDLPWVIEGKTIGEWILNQVDDTHFMLDLNDEALVARAQEFL
jgi:hypothetical protein